jgi:hypothetical protein
MAERPNMGENKRQCLRPRPSHMRWADEPDAYSIIFFARMRLIEKFWETLYNDK